MSDEVMPSQPSLVTRLRVFWDDLPLITKSIFASCLSVYIAGAAVGWDNLGQVCLSPHAVIERQIWRILSSATFHAGLLHVVFNMMAFISIGPVLERTLGSFQLAYLIALLMLAGDSLYVAVAYLASFAGYPNLLYNCAVGFSGVIFGLIPTEVRATGGAQRSIFGLVTVPALAYPWALLVLWQVLVPQSSFLGHLSGLTVGQLYAMGLLRWIVPSGEAVQRWERSNVILGRCMAYPSFIANTGSSGFGGEILSESLLPVHHYQQQQQHTGGGGFGLSQGMQRWFQGPWMPYPALLQSSAAAQQQQQQNSAAVLESPGSGSSAHRTQQKMEQQPIGSLLGGRPAELDPKAAAAAAAEARVTHAQNNKDGNR